MGETAEKPEDYEELFAHRFTSEDREYQEYLKRPSDPPPIVENWRARGGSHRGGRDNRYHERRGGHGGPGWGGRGYGGDHGWREQRGHWQDRNRDRSYDRDRHQSYDRDRDRERDRGYRGGYQSSPQGYNSQHQRPQYDRY